MCLEQISDASWLFDRFQEDLSRWVQSNLIYDSEYTQYMHVRDIVKIGKE